MDIRRDILRNVVLCQALEPLGNKPGLTGRASNGWEAAQSFQHIHSVREMTQGYPYCRRIYRFFLHNLETGVLPASELIYRFLYPEIGRADVVADLIGIGFYLVLVRHPEA